MRVSRLVTKERVEQCVSDLIELHWEEYLELDSFEKNELVTDISDAVYSLLTELDDIEDLGRPLTEEEDDRA